MKKYYQVCYEKSGKYFEQNFNTIQEAKHISSQLRKGGYSDIEIFEVIDTKGDKCQK